MSTDLLLLMEKESIYTAKSIYILVVVVDTQKSQKLPI